MGAGSVRRSAPVIASIANYFGELPLEVRLWDTNEERLDLFDQFARLCFILGGSKHRLVSTTDEVEALAGATHAIFIAGNDCLKSFSGTLVPPETCQLLILTDLIRIPGRCFSGDWPPPLTSAQRVSLPHQILRWIRSEESAVDYLKSYETSPIRSWLNGDSCPILTEVHYA